MKLTSTEKKVIRNEVKEFNERTGLNVNKDVMVRIVSSYDKTDNMAKRMIRYIGGNAVINLRQGKISDVTMLGVEYEKLLEGIGGKTSLGEIRNVSSEGQEGYEGFLNNVFGPKNRLMYKYDRIANKLSAMLDKDGVSQDVRTSAEREINTSLSATINYLYDVKNGEKTSYNSLSLRNDIRAVASSYMAASRLYNEKNIFGKWLTPSGWFLRNTMKSVENTLTEAKNALKSDIDVISLLKTSAQRENVETGLKDAFFTADNRRVMIEILDQEKEECNDKDLEVEPVLERSSLSDDDDDMELSFEAVAR